jgi:hypothetical protein
MTRTASEELTDVCIVEEQTECAERERERERVYSFDLDWVQSAPLTACIQLNLTHLIKIEQLKFNIKILNILKYQYCI